MQLTSRLVVIVSLVQSLSQAVAGYNEQSTPPTLDSLNFPALEETISFPVPVYQNQEQLLYRKLLGGYDPAVRPVLNHTMTVEIVLRMKLYQILELNEKDQTLTTNIWMEQVRYLFSIQCFTCFFCCWKLFFSPEMDRSAFEVEPGRARIYQDPPHTLESCVATGHLHLQ